MQRLWLLARRLRNKATDAVRHLWRYIRCNQLAGYKFRRQFPIGVYIVDFICVPARLAVELDGGQHLEALDYDNARTRFIESQGFRVLRFWNDDVLMRTDAVLEKILRELAAG
ncbi:endonuclease domain-containing protein [Dyella amyloliquefaciens]|uniref:endonuclease domain-containing protein n=1 Tax=Dyella amyloliquefaciens TaxID=1770545 RepID=UPI00102E8D85|nr:DUF559 domain-containing protein [Dyella amyloliquefaciens]